MVRIRRRRLWVNLIDLHFSVLALIVRIHGFLDTFRLMCWHRILIVFEIGDSIFRERVIGLLLLAFDVAFGRLRLGDVGNFRGPRYKMWVSTSFHTSRRHVTYLDLQGL